MRKPPRRRARHPPLIGLNMSVDRVDLYEKFGYLVPQSYADAVAEAGGTPVCIPPYADFAKFQRILPHLEGFLLIGGEDYRPEHYGGHPQPKEELALPERDRFDWRLSRFLLHRTRLPILGVCGGHQLLAIALGGALVQDIRTEWRPPRGGSPLPHRRLERTGEAQWTFRHSVRLAPGSLASRATGVTGALATNSFHHQAVRPERLGAGLKAAAWAEDGIIEALEPDGSRSWADGGRFVLGVQWHPERIKQEAPQLRIFRALVEAARQRK
jgi:putative glutamine amidotransferase